jgi:DNA (cytosine-5)-methyltransferase 1
MKYLSVCSGIEAATVAWHPLGWTPLAFSEIEPFPRKVLEHHYPDVRLEGDFTLLRGQQWIKDADILVGGTPCQAFSVAGLRNSLDDDRGNLTLEFVRLADAIDALRSVPSTIVWENVPGVLSVKDNAFGCFLGALAGEDAPLVAPGGRWSNAGFVDGPKRAIAWRILDAQYFGVAQRRRRLFVVASARTDFDPAEVLFEFEGVRRDIAPSRQTGENVAATVAARFGISRNNHEEVITQSVGEVAPTLTKEGTGVVRPGFQEDGWYVAIKNGSHWDGDQYPHPTLNQSARSSGGVGASNQEVFSQRGAYLAPVAARMVAFGEYVDDGTASTMKSRDYKDATDLVAQLIAFSRTDDGRDATHDLAPTMRVAGNAGGVLAAAMAQPVTYSIMPMNSGKDYKAREVDVAQPIMAGGPVGGNQGGDYIMQPTVYNISPGKGELKDDIHVTDAHISKTIDASASNPAMHQGGAAIVQAMAVRRLTPRECERLQGFPDDYTNIPKAADGPRYKALGNSMAVPVMAWIGKRIANALA